MNAQLSSTCPLCRAPSRKRLATSAGTVPFEVWWCEPCLLAFNRFFSEGAGVEANLEEFDSSHCAESWESIAWVLRRTARRRLRFLRRFTKNGKLLEIGCASGEFLVEAAGAGFTPVGLDISEQVIESNRRRLPRVPFFAGQFPHPAFASGSLDVVAGFHVFEHVPDPLGFLREALRTLRPGGLIYLRLPNVRSVARVLIGRSWYIPTHLFHHTPESVGKLLDSAGFERVALGTYVDGVTWVAAPLRPVLRLYQLRKQGFRRSKGTASPKTSAQSELGGRRERDLLRKAYNGTTHLAGSSLRPLGAIADWLGLGDEIFAVARRPA